MDPKIPRFPSDRYLPRVLCLARRAAGTKYEEEKKKVTKLSGLENPYTWESGSVLLGGPVQALRVSRKVPDGVIGGCLRCLVACRLIAVTRRTIDWFWER
jgi:hypothetical protein